VLWQFGPPTHTYLTITSMQFFFVDCSIILRHCCNSITNESSRVSYKILNTQQDSDITSRLQPSDAVKIID